MTPSPTLIASLSSPAVLASTLLETLPRTEVLLGIWGFVFGALFGSFLNVVIARVPRGESILWPPSHCFSCGQRIRARDNVPIFAWLLLRGRCRTCGAPFSPRYALVELAYAVVCAAALARHGLTVAALREILLMGFLIPLAIIDLETWLLPRVITIPGILVGVAVAGLEGWDVFARHLLAAAIGYSVIVLIGFVGERLLKKEAMGGGDPWLLALIAGFLGPRSLLPVLLLSALQGSIIGGLMILVRRRREGSAATAGGEGGEGSPQSASAGEAPSAAAPSDVAPAAEGTPRASEGLPAPAPAAALEHEGEPAEDEEDDWTPDPTAFPYGPFLALAAAEILYFTELPYVLFPF